MKNKILIIFCILLFGGLGVYLTFFSSDTSKYDSVTNAYKIEANEEIDSEGTTTYHPIYYFKVSDKEYECPSKTGSSSYPKQSKNKVYYDSDNPENCKTEYETSTNKFAGIICIGVAILIIVLLIVKSPVNNNVDINNQTNQIDPEMERKINEQVEKVAEVADKVSLVVKRVIIGIAVFIIGLLILFDVGMIKQTIKAKDYIDTTATLVSESDEHGEVFTDYVYTFTDNNGKKHDIVITLSSDEAPEQEINIKYDPTNPEDFYQDSNTYDKSGIIGFVVKIVIEIILIVLFFNKKLLSKIRLSVGNN